MSFALQKLFSVRRSHVFILFLSVSVLLGLYLGSGLLCQCVQVHLIFWYPYFFIVDEVNYLNSQIFLLLLSVCLFVVFQLRVSLCILVCPGTHFVDKTGLRLTEIHLPLPPSAGIKDMHWTPFFLNRIYLCHFACPESQSAEQGSLTLAVTCLPWAPWSLRCFIISLSLCLAINLSISLLIFFFYLFCETGILSGFGVCPGFRPGHSCTWNSEASCRESTEPLPMALQENPLSPFPPAPARAAGYISGRHRWRALWLSRMWQAQTHREAGRSGAHSLTKCMQAGGTVKKIRTAENFQKPHGGDLVPSSGDREYIRDLDSCAPETYPNVILTLPY